MPSCCTVLDYSIEPCCFLHFHRISFILWVFFFIIHGTGTLGSSHYILLMTSPPMCWNYVRREKKVAISAFFYFFLQHVRFSLLDLSVFPLKMAIFTENLSIFPVLFFFPPTPAGREILFLFFFPLTWEKDPCRDTSSIEYNKSCLRSNYWISCYCL